MPRCVLEGDGWLMATAIDGDLRLISLRKEFGEFVAVDDINVTVPDGSFFALLGPSGCGKTTTLRMIAGLELPTAGEILLGGNNVTFNRASERDIAFVFQLFALYPHMNVRANIGFPLKCDGVARDVGQRSGDAQASEHNEPNFRRRGVGRR